MRTTVAAASTLGVAIGAHPGLPDLAGFGRRAMQVTPQEVYDMIIYQVGALIGFARAAGAELQHVKPHGALYNDAHRDRALAEVIIDAMRAVDPALAIVCSASSRMAAAARDAGTPVIREAFADRRYEPDGSLMSRKLPGSLLDVDQAAAQAALLAREGVAVARDASSQAQPGCRPPHCISARSARLVSASVPDCCPRP